MTQAGARGQSSRHRSSDVDRRVDARLAVVVLIRTTTVTGESQISLTRGPASACTAQGRWHRRASSSPTFPRWACPRGDNCADRGLSTARNAIAPQEIARQIQDQALAGLNGHPAIFGVAVPRFLTTVSRYSDTSIAAPCSTSRLACQQQPAGPTSRSPGSPRRGKPAYRTPLDTGKPPSRPKSLR